VCLCNEHLCFLFIFLKSNVITFNSAPVCSAPQTKNGDVLFFFPFFPLFFVFGLEALLNASWQLAWWLVSKRWMDAQKKKLLGM